MSGEREINGASVNDWVNVVRRARIDRAVKCIALLLASYASPDGTSAYPGVARLAVQSGYDYRTVQRALGRLRDMGLIQAVPRKGLPRTWNTPYRLTFASDTIELADVPTPAAEDAAVNKLRLLYRGKHRARSRDLSAEQLHDTAVVQSENCTTRGATTARHDPPADQRERQTTLHGPLPNYNPPLLSADVVDRVTGSARARETDDGESAISGREDGQPPTTWRPPERWRDDRAEAARQAAESRAARLAREASA